MTDPTCPVCLDPVSQDDVVDSPMGQVHAACRPEAMQQWADYERDMHDMMIHEQNSKERDL